MYLVGKSVYTMHVWLSDVDFFSTLILWAGSCNILLYDQATVISRPILYFIPIRILFYFILCLFLYLCKSCLYVRTSLKIELICLKTNHKKCFTLTEFGAFSLLKAYL